jgi:hypothetical protein
MKATLDAQAWRLVKALADGRHFDVAGLQRRAERLLKARAKSVWWPPTKRCR